MTPTAFIATHKIKSREEFLSKLLSMGILPPSEEEILSMFPPPPPAKEKEKEATEFPSDNQVRQFTKSKTSTKSSGSVDNRKD